MGSAGCTACCANLLSKLSMHTPTAGTGIIGCEQSHKSGQGGALPFCPRKPILAPRYMPTPTFFRICLPFGAVFVALSRDRMISLVSWLYAPLHKGQTHACHVKQSACCAQCTCIDTAHLHSIQQSFSMDSSCQLCRCPHGIFYSLHTYPHKKTRSPMQMDAHMRDR